MSSAREHSAFLMNRRVPVLVCIFLLVLFNQVYAGGYPDSAHGDSAHGVSRPPVTAGGGGAGQCIHCHDSRANRGNDFQLFAQRLNNQTSNICFDCHGNGAVTQTGGNIINRSYSYRAGGWTSDPLNNIADSFVQTSSHNLSDIAVFLSGKWNYTALNNPCTGCHNHHAAQGDPENAPNSTKSSGSRGWMVSRPSEHGDFTNWGLWGDDAGEKMNTYAGPLKYQAPYRYGSTTLYEPDGTSVSDGSNLADTVTVCTDCHNQTNNIWSSSLGRYLNRFDWSAEKHGKGAATDDAGNEHVSPYQDTQAGQYVLACTDCHEPHGSPNRLLTRKVTNGKNVTIPGDRGEWKSFCITCHQNPTSDAHHLALPGSSNCSINCHYMVWVPNPGVYVTAYRECTECHYHGSTQYYDGTAGTYKTYNGGEHLF